MKIALLGYGKMGKAIESIAIDHGHEIVLKIDSSNRDQLNTKSLADADVAIEFSTPAAAYDNILLCFEAGVPVVVGTTAWLDKLDEVSGICTDKNGTLFYASNFSIGVNLFFRLNKDLSTLMDGFKQYNASMEEVHHTEKLDAPSGTAITLAEGLIDKSSSKSKWVNDKTSQENELGIISVRAPNVPGTHAIRFDSDVDTIEIKHTAHSRTGFAEGAVIASEWIKDRKGVFTMDDMLNF